MHRFVSLCRLEKSATDRGAASDASKTPPKVVEEPLQTCRDANVYAFASLHVCNSPTWYQVGLSQVCNLPSQTIFVLLQICKT